MPRAGLSEEGLSRRDEPPNSRPPMAVATVRFSLIGLCRASVERALLLVQARRTSRIRLEPSAGKKHRSAASVRIPPGSDLPLRLNVKRKATLRDLTKCDRDRH